MNKILSPDEITAGMFVTVVDCKPREIPSLDLFGMFRVPGEEWKSETTTTSKTMVDRSYMGDVLCVKAVNHPFLVLRRISQSDWDKQPFTLDMRERTFAQLSDEYVQAMCPFQYPEKKS